jgi:metal-sulfur cluster biosynthetic enzyme
MTATTRAEVMTALATVRDPELDEPVTSLGFVASCEVSTDAEVEVHLRLPTYFCAPNFAFLMVADAYDAVRAIGGVRQAVVILDDHFASDAINAGVAARAGFVGSFGDEAVDELDTLRRNFVRKAVLAGTDRVCRPLFARGTSPHDLVGTTLGDLEASDDLELLRARRREIGLPDGDDAILLVDVETGAPIGPDDVRLHLGRARLTGVNIEANGSICRGMLASRYGVGATSAETRAEDAP